MQLQYACRVFVPLPRFFPGLHSHGKVPGIDFNGFGSCLCGFHVQSVERRSYEHLIIHTLSIRSARQRLYNQGVSESVLARAQGLVSMSGWCLSSMTLKTPKQNLLWICTYVCVCVRVYIYTILIVVNYCHASTHALYDSIHVVMAAKAVHCLERVLSGSLKLPYTALKEFWAEV